MSADVTLLIVPSGPERRDAADDIEPRMRRLVRRGKAVVIVWLGIVVAWATCAPISGGVVAQGVVKVESNRRTVSHRDGGTVASILVTEGQSVERGQRLIELEDVRVDAAFDAIHSELAAGRLRQSRFEAEVAFRPDWVPPEALNREFAGVKRLGEFGAKERAAFAARRTNLLAQIEGEQRQAVQTRTEIEARTLERGNATKAVSLMQQELAANQALLEQNFVNRTRIMTLQRAETEYESRRLGNEAELAQARQRLGASDARVRGLRDSYVQSASEELRDVAAKVADLEQRLRSSADDQMRQLVTAPVAGRLLNLRVNTVGSAIGPREPIVDIVPGHAPLQVEARLPLDAAADVKPGTAAEVRLVTAHQRFERLLPARVARVSADALSDERSGASYFIVTLEVPAEALAQAGTHLQPGLGAEVYIKVSERTPMGFLMEPVAGFFRRGFRER